MTTNILFNSLDGDALTLLIDVMAKKTFVSGEDIITQGSQGDYYYVLQSGTCDIFKDGALVLQCSKGMGFGELVRAPVVAASVRWWLTLGWVPLPANLQALMYDAPRAATVRATSDVVVRRLPALVGTPTLAC